MCCSGEPFNFTAKDSNVHAKWESKDRQAQFKPHTGTGSQGYIHVYIQGSRGPSDARRFGAEGPRLGKGTLGFSTSLLKSCCYLKL